MTEILDRLEEAADEIERLRNDTRMLWDAVAEKNAEIKRLRADLDKLMSERQGWLNEIEELRSALAQHGLKA